MPLQSEFVNVSSPVGPGLQVPSFCCKGMADSREVGLHTFPLVREGIGIKTVGAKIPVGKGGHYLYFIPLIQFYGTFIKNIIYFKIRIMPVSVGSIMGGRNGLSVISQRQGAGKTASP